MKPVFFDAKDPDEVKQVVFDFGAVLGGESLAGVPVVSIAVYSGTDASPGDVLNGAASVDVSGTKVTQGVKAGVANVDYRLKAKVATSGGRTLAQGRILPVRNA